MTAIECVSQELDRITTAMNECVTEHGYVKSSCRYKYQILVKQANAFKTSKDWLEAQETAI